MFYTIYQITNLINHSIYIGKHQTKNLDDGYMGSGKRLGQAKRKYGCENFKKEILFIFDNEQEMNDKEKELVNEEFCLREDTYNLCIGGNGGFSFINDSSNQHLNRARNAGKLGGQKSRDECEKVHGVKTRRKLKPVIEKIKETNRKMYGGIGFQIKENRLKREKNIKEKYNVENVSQIPEVNRKIKETFAKINHSKGSKNSQFGTMWITNGIENKKINKNNSIPNGWKQGRKMKKVYYEANYES